MDPCLNPLCTESLKMLLNCVYESAQRLFIFAVSILTTVLRLAIIKSPVCVQKGLISNKLRYSFYALLLVN